MEDWQFYGFDGIEYISGEAWRFYGNTMAFKNENGWLRVGDKEEYFDYDLSQLRNNVISLNYVSMFEVLKMNIIALWRNLNE